MPSLPVRRESLLKRLLFPCAGNASPLSVFTRPGRPGLIARRSTPDEIRKTGNRGRVKGTKTAVHLRQAGIRPASPPRRFSGRGVSPEYMRQVFYSFIFPTVP